LSEEKKERTVTSDYDLDQLEVRLLFLVEHPNQMHASTSFLNRRGWKTETTKDAAQALRLVSKEKFDYVLVSVNHPNPKVTQLSLVIPRSFSTPVVAIAEKADAKSIGLLNTSRTAEKLLGRVSGPAIHRKIRQLLAIKYGLVNEKSESSNSTDRAGDTYNNPENSSDKNNERQKANDSSEEKSDYIRFKRETVESGYFEMSQLKKNAEEGDGEKSSFWGNSKTKRKQDSITQEAAEEAEATDQLIEEESLSEEYLGKEVKTSRKRRNSFDDEESDKASNGVLIQKGARGDVGKHLPKHNNSKDAETYDLHEGNKPWSSNSIVSAEKLIADLGLDEEASVQEEDSSLVGGDLGSAEENNNLKNINQESGQESTNKDKHSDQQVNIDKSAERENEQTLIETKNNDKEKKESEFPRVERKIWVKNKEASDLFAPIRESLETLSKKSSIKNEAIKLPQKHNTIGIVPFEAAGQKLFLLIVKPDPEKNLVDLVVELCKEIESSQPAKLLNYRISDLFIYQCSDLDLEKITHTFGRACLSDIIGDIEVSVSVFDRNPTALSEELMDLDTIRKKLKIENEYLKPDMQIDFNLYLKLMPSQRVIKYLNSGRKLSLKQIDNLIEKRAEVFVDSSESDNILKYMMLIELENLVQTAKLSLTDDKAA
jgi:hypothetical protein